MGLQTADFVRVDREEVGVEVVEAYTYRATLRIAAAETAPGEECAGRPAWLSYSDRHGWQFAASVKPPKMGALAPNVCDRDAVLREYVSAERLARYRSDGRLIDRLGELPVRGPFVGLSVGDACRAYPDMRPAAYVGAGRCIFFLDALNWSTAVAAAPFGNELAEQYPSRAVAEAMAPWVESAVPDIERIPVCVGCQEECRQSAVALGDGTFGCRSCVASGRCGI